MSVLDSHVQRRAEAATRRFLTKEVPNLLNLCHKPTGKRVRDAVKKRHGHETSIRQADRAIETLRHLDPSQQEEDSKEIGTHIALLNLLISD